MPFLKKLGFDRKKQDKLLDPLIPSFELDTHYVLHSEMPPVNQLAGGVHDTFHQEVIRKIQAMPGSYAHGS